MVVVFEAAERVTANKRINPTSRAVGYHVSHRARVMRKHVRHSCYDPSRVGMIGDQGGDGAAADSGDESGP